jgi:hypothetical protein
MGNDAGDGPHRRAEVLRSRVRRSWTTARIRGSSRHGVRRRSTDPRRRYAPGRPKGGGVRFLFREGGQSDRLRIAGGPPHRGRRQGNVRHPMVPASGPLRGLRLSRSTLLRPGHDRRAAKDFTGKMGFEVRFDTTIPSGAPTCHFTLWKATDEEKEEWKKYTGLLEQKALVRAKKRSTPSGDSSR